MGKGANKGLLSNEGQGQQQQSQLQGKAYDISNFLTPQLESDVNNPKGYTPQQLAYMNTASQQSLGGSVGGVTGEANLEAARTRNAGGFQGVAESAARSAQRQLSQNALGIQQKQADLQQQQRQEALRALQALYGVDEATALGYLNASTAAGTAEKGNNSGLLKTILGSAIGAGGQAGTAYLENR